MKIQNEKFKRRDQVLGHYRDFMLLTIDHIQLAMPRGEEEKARSYFTQLLGMEEERKPETLAMRGGCWFRSGVVVIHLGVENDFRPQKKAHPALVVLNLDLLATQLQEGGYPVQWDNALGDRRRFYSEDPFGNRIEFMERDDL
ncbi:MAG: glyoxalase [Candidatus Kapaibacterium sp.]